MGEKEHVLRDRKNYSVETLCIFNIKLSDKQRMVSKIESILGFG